MTRISWPAWQQQVLNKIRRDYADILQQLTLDDIDWPSWRDLYDRGQSAKEAVDYAFVRDSATSNKPRRRY